MYLQLNIGIPIKLNLNACSFIKNSFELNITLTTNHAWLHLPSKLIESYILPLHKEHQGI